MMRKRRDECKEMSRKKMDTEHSQLPRNWPLRLTNLGRQQYAWACALADDVPWTTAATLGTIMQMRAGSCCFTQ